ncbi:hypothetical protein KAK07_08805 [Ideonella sp. 4Y16]|uniref:hypothetical protein n=1 Tax=Ideonella alba TaxID=2824118 RepID=UPI001B37072E|nr:hypothetical protein [Ideonella alba]MBQ0943433.1 hypothetical protein [Ideonella alba]
MRKKVLEGLHDPSTVGCKGENLKLLSQSWTNRIVYLKQGYDQLFDQIVRVLSALGGVMWLLLFN